MPDSLYTSLDAFHIRFEIAALVIRLCSCAQPVELFIYDVSLQDCWASLKNYILTTNQLSDAVMIGPPRKKCPIVSSTILTDDQTQPTGAPSGSSTRLSR